MAGFYRVLVCQVEAADRVSTMREPFIQTSIDIGSSTISRAIGIFSERMHRPVHGQSDAEIASKELLKAADGDISVAKKILQRVFAEADA